MEAQNWIARFPSPPELEPPATREEWAQRRLTIRSQLQQLLGALPPRKFPEVKRQVEIRDGYTCEKISFDNGAGSTVFGYLLLPQNKAARKSPAILYCHWHGDDYHVGKEELFQTSHTPEGPGPELARRGYAVLAIDAYCFGERSGRGPCGPSEKGRDEELSAAKFNLWIGRSLWGMILRDDLLALDYLASRPEVDASRIGAMGISMGATRTWWLMALDERLRAGMAAACLTRYQDLVAASGLNKHGIYYYVPDMLRNFDTEAVVSLIAPRPILFQNGDKDGGSPVSGIRSIEKLVKPIWELTGRPGEFESIVFPGLGHEFTPEMWQRTLAWFRRHLH